MWKDAEEYLSKDKYLGYLVNKWGSCTIIQITESAYFEDLVDAICSQQLSGKAARTIFNRVKECLGEVTPQAILKVSDQKLRDCGLSWAKVGYVKDLSTKVKNSTLRLDVLDKLQDEDIVQALVGVSGIGRWTAEVFLMFSWARPDVFPLDDLGIKNGMRILFGKELSRDEMIKKSNAWKPYRTVASWYIWRSLDA